jgi:hypothetical protein
VFTVKFESAVKSGKQSMSLDLEGQGATAGILYSIVLLVTLIVVIIIRTHYIFRDPAKYTSGFATECTLETRETSEWRWLWYMR